MAVFLANVSRSQTWMTTSGPYLKSVGSISWNCSVSYHRGAVVMLWDLVRSFLPQNSRISPHYRYLCSSLAGTLRR